MLAGAGRSLQYILLSNSAQLRLAILGTGLGFSLSEPLETALRVTLGVTKPESSVAMLPPLPQQMGS